MVWKKRKIEPTGGLFDDQPAGEKPAEEAAPAEPAEEKPADEPEPPTAADKACDRAVRRSWKRG